VVAHREASPALGSVDLLHEWIVAGFADFLGLP
jgi:hypothetical protein